MHRENALLVSAVAALCQISVVGIVTLLLSHRSLFTLSRICKIDELFPKVAALRAHYPNVPTTWNNKTRSEHAKTFSQVIVHSNHSANFFYCRAGQRTCCAKGGLFFLFLFLFSLMSRLNVLRIRGCVSRPRKRVTGVACVEIGVCIQIGVCVKYKTAYSALSERGAKFGAPRVAKFAWSISFPCLFRSKIKFVSLNRWPRVLKGWRKVKQDAADISLHTRRKSGRSDSSEKKAHKTLAKHLRGGPSADSRR